MLRNYSPNTVFLNTPIPSTTQTTSSPSFRNFLGLKPIPTPAGVPVAIMSPGFKVTPFENSLII